MIILVAYDIRDDSARLAFQRDLERHGFSRVQKSVYARRGGYKALSRRVALLASRRINPATDTVLIMEVPDWALEKAIILGVGGAPGGSAKIL